MEMPILQDRISNLTRQHIVFIGFNLFSLHRIFTKNYLKKITKKNLDFCLMKDGFLPYGS